MTHGGIRKLGVVVLILGFWCLPTVAQTTTKGKVDYAQVRPFIQGYEAAINDVISSTFTNPFGLVQQPKGVYLPGYGYTFSFLVNIRRGMIQTPFGAYAPDSDIGPEQIKQRIDGLKDKLVRVLLSSQSITAKLEGDESISIIAFIKESDPLSPETDVNKTLIMSILKSDLQELSSKPDRINEFKQRVKIVEY